jgi:hypothetical protein
VVYKCIRDGQTILTDKPCDGAAVESTVPSQTATIGGPQGSTVVPLAPIGKWRGQAQFQISENGRHVEQAHTVVVLELAFERGQGDWR